MKTRLNEILVPVLLLMLTSPALCLEWNKKIISGIDYQHIKVTSESIPIHVHVLKVDMKNPKVNVKPVLAKGIIGDLERTSEIALRSKAIAAINGSFFAPRKKLHLPVGFMIIDGRIINKSMLERTTIGITKNKEIIFGTPMIKGYALNLDSKKSVEIWAINRPRKKDETIVYTKEYGKSTRTNPHGREIIVDGKGFVTAVTTGDVSIPDDGFVVSLHGWSRDFVKMTKIGDRIALYYNLADKWKNVEQAITGGPLLVRDGEIVQKESLVSEKFNDDMLPPNARTAIGVTASNELIMVVADKRVRMSKGITYDELAEIMKNAGAVNAMGLDGGHASAMYLNGKLVNYPKWGYDAPVSNALVVTYDGWKLPKIIRPVVVAKFVYRPPSEELLKALREEAQLTPTYYIPRPEDFGMWGLQDLYNRTVKPVVPEILIQQLFSAP